MNVIAQIVDRLERYPSLVYKVDGQNVRVEPASSSGFLVSLTDLGGTFVVAFDGWHEQFQSAAEALNCFGFGLSDQCRLKVLIKGTTEYRWTIERRIADGWIEDSTTGLLLFPFWRPMKIVFRQNKITEAASQP